MNASAKHAGKMNHRRSGLAPGVTNVIPATIEPHAGHGLTYDNVQPIAAIPQLAELNIGHYLIGEAIFDGLENAVRRMRELMDAAR